MAPILSMLKTNTVTAQLLKSEVGSSCGRRGRAVRPPRARTKVVAQTP